MKQITSKHLAGSLLLAGMALGSSAFAASTWTSSNFGALCTSTSQKVADAGVWGKCGASGSSDPMFMGLSTAISTTTSPSAGATFAAAAVYDWGDTNGLGVINRFETDATGPHAVDNYRGTDAVLLRFQDAVTLTSFKIGWNGTDHGQNTTYNGSDVSILAWTGNSIPNAASVGPASAGWSWVGNYASVGTMGNTEYISPKTSSGAAVYSSYWLVSAYDSAYGSTSSNQYSLGTGSDAFKLLAIAGSCKLAANNSSNCEGVPVSLVPEPGSLALLGAGLMGIAAARRRQRKAV